MYNKKVWNTGERITADKLNNIEEGVYSNALVNKTQQVYINGLFNENKDGRLSVEGEGNDLKLEGSKEGLVEVDKIVGNTLVNIANFSDKEYEFTLNNGGYYNTITLCDLSLIEVNTDYTLLFDIEIVNNATTWSLGSNTKFVLGQGNSQNSVSGHPVINSISNNGISYNLWNTICYSTNVVKFNLSSLNTTYTKYFAIRPLYSEQLGEGQSITYKVKNLMLFKGDITSNPPKEYIEGLQSSFESNLVTQEMIEQGLESEENLGKYKVPVRLVGKNLWSYGDILQTGVKQIILDKPLKAGVYTVSSTTKTIYATHPHIAFQNGSKVVGYQYLNQNKSFTLYENVDSVVLYSNGYNYNNSINNPINFTNIQIEEGTVATDREEYFERTTNVYLNSPLLEGDEIVMHDGELCHYHKYGKEVLDGSGDWIKADTSITTTHIKTSVFLLEVTGSNAGSLCDKFVNNTNMTSDTEFYYYNTSFFGGSKLIISINNSKLSTQNLTGFKAWLKANPTTVVYQLAEPYYEPIQSDKLLLECANSSTLHLDTVVPVESVNVSYTGNVPSVYALEETNNNQDSLIDISLCATDEMYMMIEPLLEVVPQTLNNERMMSKMVDMYVAMVIRELKTIEEVPVRYREQVKEILAQLEK